MILKISDHGIWIKMAVFLVGRISTSPISYQRKSAPEWRKERTSSCSMQYLANLIMFNADADKLAGRLNGCSDGEHFRRVMAKYQVFP